MKKGTLRSPSLGGSKVVGSAVSKVMPTFSVRSCKTLLKVAVPARMLDWLRVKVTEKEGN